LTITISVLYVDDESSLLEIGKIYLERTHEFAVTTVSSATDGLERLKSNGIQAIVSDYQMPGMDGIGFLKQVRAMNKTIPFILFTGKGREDIAIEAFENGADFYLQKGGAPKPQFAELTTKIKSAVEHRAADEQVTVLNRLYTVLSATNRAIVRIHDKKELLNEICRIAVDDGGFTMVWAGIANPEKHLIEPIAMAGNVKGYIDAIAISTDDIPRGRGPTGTAFRKNTFNVCNDIVNDPKMTPWRKGALEQGYRSLASFPFAHGTGNAGVITFYASEPGFFTPQIIRLLEEQTGDISFALVTMEHEEQRSAAEKHLKKSELQYRRLFETAQDAILIIDGDSGDIIDANKFILDMLGYPLEYFVGKHLWELGFLKDKSLSEKAFAELETDGYIRYDDLPLETKQGRAISVEFVSNVYLVGDKRIIQCNIRDITQQKIEAEEHRRLAAIVKFSDDAIIGKTLDGVIVSWNAGAELIYGYTAEEAIGKPISILVPPGKRDEIPGILEKIRAGERISHMETKRLTKDGRIIDVSLTVSPIKNKQGLIVGASTIARDITEHRRDLDEIVKARNEWESTFNSIPDLIAIIDKNFRLVRVNKAMADRLGVSPDDAVGRTCYETVHHTSCPVEACPHRLLLADGRPHTVDIHEENLKGDFTLSVSPAFDPSGKITGSVHILHDITRRKQAEEEHVRLATIVEFSDNAIIGKTLEGIITSWNTGATKLYGYTAEEAIGNPISILVPPSGRDEIPSILERIRAGERISHLETKRRTNDGRIIDVSMSVSPIKNKDGLIVGASTIAHDITEHKRMEEALRESEERVRTIIEQSPLSIEVMSPDGRTVQVNNAFEKLWGVTLDDLKDYNILHDEQLTRLGIMPFIERGFSGEAVTFPAVQYDGSKTLGFGATKWIQGNIYPVRDIAGTIRNVILVQEDITERKRMEEALQESRFQLEDAMDQGRMAYWEFDLPTKTFTFNDRFYALYGTTADREGGYRMSGELYTRAFVHPDDTGVVAYEIEKSITSDMGRLYEMEHRIVRRDGEVRHIVVRYRTSLDRNGQTIKNYGVNQDITERKRAEDALKVSEDKYRTILENMQDLFYRTDLVGKITMISPAGARLAGYESPDDLIGMDSAVLYADPENRQQLIADLKENRSVFNYPVTLHVRDGSVRYVTTSSHFYSDAGGTVRGVEGLIHDITGLRLAEDALRESEKRYRDMFELNNAVMLILNPDTGSIVDANSAAIHYYGYSWDEITHLVIPDINITDPAIIKKEMSRAVENPGTIFTFRHRKKNGEIRDVEVFSGPITLGGKNFLHSIIQDVTERKLAEEALRQANRKLNLLSSITRHDINNQLLALSSYLELSKESLGDAAKISEYIIKEERAATAIGRQIVFTKEYQDLGVNAPVWQDVEKSIRKAVAVLPMRDIRVAADINNLEIYADPLFEKVFYNLIDNALRYGGQKMKRIRITSRESEAGLVISAEDDGDGISAEYKKNLFKRGFGHNTGLGLFLSREILSITGITITETGESGTGARFEISVPKGSYRT
jgi:PAS domain S-box-containing protein